MKNIFLSYHYREMKIYTDFIIFLIVIFLISIGVYFTGKMEINTKIIIFLIINFIFLSVGIFYAMKMKFDTSSIIILIVAFLILSICIYYFAKKKSYNSVKDILPTPKQKISQQMEHEYSPEKEHFKNNNDIIVAYYAIPGCPYCINFDKEWEVFVESTKNTNIITRKILCGETTTTECSRVTRFPTIYIYFRGDDNPLLYKGERTAEKLYNFINNYPN